MCFSANGKTSNHTLMPFKDKLCRRGVFFVHCVQSLYYRLHSVLLFQFGCEFAFCDYSPDNEHLKMLAFHIPATYSIFWPSEFMKKPKARHSHQQMCLATVSDRTNRFTSHPIE